MNKEYGVFHANLPKRIKNNRSVFCKRPIRRLLPDADIGFVTP